jgi:hypothetical protein
MGIKGKFFVLASRDTALVMDIKGGNACPGAEVVMWEKHGGDNQLWCYDPLTRTIRTKADRGFCLDINDANRLAVNPVRPGDKNQQWEYDKKGKVIRNADDHDRVLDVVGQCKDEGASICAWEYNGGDNQLWKPHFEPMKYFYIKSELNGKVLDVEGGDSSPGTKVVMFSKKDDDGDRDNQLWFEDRYGNIRSKLNEKLVLDAEDGILKVDTFDLGRKRNFWTIDGKRIVNVHNHDEVIDIKGNNADDCAELCAWDYHGASNQHWHFDYVDE